jgi:hypothetical protein
MIPERTKREVPVLKGEVNVTTVAKKGIGLETVGMKVAERKGKDQSGR